MFKRPDGLAGASIAFGAKSFRRTGLRKKQFLAV
jgi:hypothetical protein